MSSAKITLLGFYDYFNHQSNDLFTELELPESVDKKLLIDTILLRGGEFEVVYSNPYFMRSAVGVWSKKWYRTINKWVEALAISYNPLENYDRFEDWTDTGNGNSSGSDNSTSNGSGDTVNTRSAFDSSDYQPHDKTDVSSAQTVQSTTASHTDNTGVHTGRMHGNIGVTTSQQMLLSELNEAAVWNLYDHIADVFLSEFVIQVY